MKRPMVLPLNLLGSTSKMGYLSSLRFANDSRHARRLSRLLKSQTNGTTRPSGVNDNGSRFSGKVTYGRHAFLCPSLTKRGKEKPAVKMEKPKNVLRSKTTNRHTAFKCTIRGDC